MTEDVRVKLGVKSSLKVSVNFSNPGLTEKYYYVSWYTGKS